MIHSLLKVRIAVVFLLVAIAANTGRAMNFEYAEQVRKRVAAHDPVYAAAMTRLLAAADKAMKAGPFSVTDKKILAPSKDPKDYVSLAPYFWPDASKPDGVPYMNRDGQVNPETRSGDYSDRDRMEQMFTAVRTLDIAAYMTGKVEYARHSAELLRTFYLDAKTGMNPNLNFAQGVRGSVTGRSYGIIDLNSVGDVLDSIKLMEQVAPAEVWSEADRKGLRDWCSRFLDWLSTSEFGATESHAANNHGAWFDATASCFADFVGDSERVKQLVKASEARIGKQIKADGTMPLEMARTKSWHYTLFALSAYAITSERARRVGEDLWHYQPGEPSAGNLNKAVENLLHYTETKEPWPKKDIDKPEDPMLLYLRVRSILDPGRDGDLCKRLDAALAGDATKLESLPQVLTVGPVPGK